MASLLQACMRPADDETPVAKRARLTPKLELLYFNVDGKGEPLRLMMGHAKLAFDDTRISFDQFKKMKESGELAFGQVPMLKVDGTTQLVQTNAVARFIAQISADESLYPSDPLKAAKVDAVCDQNNDMFGGILPATYQERFGFDTALGGASGEGTKKVQEKLRTDVLPRHLGFLQKLLDASESGWLADTAGPSAADFIMAPALKQLPKLKVWGDAGADDLLAKFPKIQKYVEKFYALDCCKAVFSITAEELMAQSIAAFKAKGIELGQPLSDEDAALIASSMGEASVDLPKSQAEIDAKLGQIKDMPKEAFEQTIEMIKMMAGKGAGKGN